MYKMLVSLRILVYFVVCTYLGGTHACWCVVCTWCLILCRKTHNKVNAMNEVGLRATHVVDDLLLHS